MQRAVIYARFSSENQHQESIEAQIFECTAYCQKKDYAVVKTYVDEALSGTEATKRKSYNAMLADARKGVFDVVIFHKIDRFYCSDCLTNTPPNRLTALPKVSLWKL